MHSRIHSSMHATLYILYVLILYVYTPVLSHTCTMRSTLYWLRYGHYTAHTIRTKVYIIRIFPLYSKILNILYGDEYTLRSLLLIPYYTYNIIHSTPRKLCQTYYTVNTVLYIPHHNILHYTRLHCTCYTAHALICVTTAYALCMLHCTNCSSHTKSTQSIEHQTHFKGYAYLTAHVANAFMYSTVRVFLLISFYPY